MWASLALELLAKAALARVSPLLVAVPTEDGENLLIASGLLSGDARFSSIPARTLYVRCHKAFKPFSEKEASAITQARNEYLHGAAAGFTSIPPRGWWPRYWAQVRILVNALDRNLEDLVGIDRLPMVEKYLATNKKNNEDHVRTLIERAKQRLGLRRSGGLPERVAAEMSRRTWLTAGLRYSTPESCPACGGEGQVEGEDVIDFEIRTEQVSEDSFDSVAVLSVDSSYFSCPHCRLVLEEYELLSEAGLPDTFEYIEEDITEWISDDYGND